jgi:hypothetical protein
VAGAPEEAWIAELIAVSKVSVKHGGDNYLFISYNGGQELACRMICPSASLDSEIGVILPPEDSGYLSRALEQDGRALGLSYDFPGGVASITAGKHNYHFNFTDGTYSYEVNYRAADLERLIDTSPDGKLELYATNLDGGGEAGWGDYVTLNTQTGEITFLAYYDLYDQAVFCGTDKLLLIRRYNYEGEGNTIALLDASAGNALPGAPEFDFGKSDFGDDLPKYEIAGIAYDHPQRKTLIAYREFGNGSLSFERTAKVYLAVFDETGKQISTTDTGFLMQPHRNSFPNRIAFDSAGDGAAVLSTYDNALGDIVLGSVSY